MDACAAVSLHFLLMIHVHTRMQTHTFAVLVEPMIFLEISSI